MKTNTKTKLAGVLLPLILSAGAANAVTTIISNDFNGVADDIGPDLNGIGFGGTADTSTGLMTLGSQTNFRATFITSSAVDVSSPSITSFTITWNISGGNNLDRIGGEGNFFGVVNSGASNNWYDSQGIGIMIDGGNRAFDWSVVEVDSSPNNDTAYALSTSRPAASELEDGFSLSLTLNSDNTYAVSTTGLANNDTSTGSFGNRVTYDDLKSNLFVYGELAGGGSPTIDMTVSSVELTVIPEPSTTALLGLGGLALILRRRK